MDDALAAELRAAGVSEEEIEDHRQGHGQRQDEAPGVQLAAHLWPAVQLFRAMDTQWLWVSTMERAVRTGLNHAALDATAEWSGIRVGSRRAMFRQLKVMENETLLIDREQRD